MLKFIIIKQVSSSALIQNNLKSMRRRSMQKKQPAIISISPNNSIHNSNSSSPVSNRYNFRSKQKQSHINIDKKSAHAGQLKANKRSASTLHNKQKVQSQTPSLPQNSKNSNTNNTTSNISNNTTNTKTYEIQKILRRRIVNNRQQLLVQWKGYTSNSNRWVDRCSISIKGYHNNKQIDQYIKGIILDKQKQKQVGKSNNGNSKVKNVSIKKNSNKKRKIIKKKKKMFKSKIKNGQVIDLLQSSASECENKDVDNNQQKQNQSCNNQQQHKVQNEKIQEQQHQDKKQISIPVNIKQAQQFTVNIVQMQAHTNENADSSATSHPSSHTNTNTNSNTNVNIKNGIISAAKQSTSTTNSYKIPKIKLNLNFDNDNSQKYVKKYSEQQLNILHKFYKEDCRCYDCVMKMQQ